MTVRFVLANIFPAINVDVEWVLPFLPHVNDSIDLSVVDHDVSYDDLKNNGNCVKCIKWSRTTNNIPSPIIFLGKRIK